MAHHVYSLQMNQTNVGVSLGRVLTWNSCHCASQEAPSLSLFLVVRAVPRHLQWPSQHCSAMSTDEPFPRYPILAMFFMFVSLLLKIERARETREDNKKKKLFLSIELGLVPRPQKDKISE